MSQTQEYEEVLTPKEQEALDFIKAYGKVNLPFFKDHKCGGSIPRAKRMINKFCHLGVCKIEQENYVRFINS